jgi:hypothetical protein
MTNATPVWNGKEVIGMARSWKQATKLLGHGAQFAKRECGWCWI